MITAATLSTDERSAPATVLPNMPFLPYQTLLSTRVPSLFFLECGMRRRKQTETKSRIMFMGPRTTPENQPSPLPVATATAMSTAPMPAMVRVWCLTDLLTRWKMKKAAAQTQAAPA